MGKYLVQHVGITNNGQQASSSSDGGVETPYVAEEADAVHSVGTYYAFSPNSRLCIVLYLSCSFQSRDARTVEMMMALRSFPCISFTESTLTFLIRVVSSVS